MNTKVESLLAETDWLRKLARQLVSDPASAEDLAQDTVVATLEGGQQVRGEGRPWLARVARHRAARLSRTDQRRRRSEAARPKPEPSPSALETSARFELHRNVVEAVRSLREPYREAVLLRFWEDLPPRLIGKRIGVPVETAKTRLVRGLAMLRDKLDQQYGGRACWVAPLRLWIHPAVRAGILGAQKLLVVGALVLTVGVVSWAMGIWDSEPVSPSTSRQVAVAGSSGAGTTVTTAVTPTATPRTALLAQLPAQVPGEGLEIRVLDGTGAPVEGARVFRFESHPGAISPVQETMNRLMTSPRRGDPSVYAWLEKTQALVRTDRDGRARIAKITTERGGVLAFTEQLDGGLPILGSHQGPIQLRLHPRRVGRVRVTGIGQRPEDQVLVGFRWRGRVQHAAWTEGGLARILLVAKQSHIELSQDMAKGEYAILLPLGSPGSRQAVDLSAGPDQVVTLEMPATGCLELVCRDDAGKPISVAGEVELTVKPAKGLVAKGFVARSFVAEDRQPVVAGVAKFDRVGLGQQFSIVVKIEGRETPLQVDQVGPTTMSRTTEVVIRITEDVQALRRAADQRRRQQLFAQIQRQETGLERELLLAAADCGDSWSLEVITGALIQHRAFDRAVVALRRFQARQVERLGNGKILHYSPPFGARSSYVQLGFQASEVLIAEYRRQLNQTDLWGHRAAIVSALGSYSKNPQAGVPFVVSVFWEDPHPRVRATSLFSIGAAAEFEIGERCFTAAIEDPAIRENYIDHYFAALSNLTKRSDEAPVARLRDALLQVEGLRDSTRASIKALRSKQR